MMGPGLQHRESSIAVRPGQEQGISSLKELPHSCNLGIKLLLSTLTSARDDLTCWYLQQRGKNLWEGAVDQGDEPLFME